MSTPINIADVMANITYVLNTYSKAKSKHVGRHEDLYDVYASYDEVTDTWTDLLGRGTFADAWSQAALIVEHRGTA